VTSYMENPASKIYMAKLDCSYMNIVWENEYSESGEISARDGALREDYVYALERDKETGSKTWDWQLDNGSLEEACAIAVNPLGIYTTGQDQASDAAWTVNIPIKDPNPNWDPAWQRIFTPPENEMEVRDIAVDTLGNVYVVGSVFNNGLDRGVIIKYDDSGNLEWFKTLQTGATTGFDCAVCDEHGDLFVGGGDGALGILAKYNPQGEKITSVNEDMWISSLCYKDGYLYAVRSGVENSQERTRIMKYKDLNAVEEKPSSSSSPSINLEVSGNRISYSILAPSDVSLKLYDVSGQLVSVIFSGSVSPGLHTLDMNTRSLSRGCYFVRLEASGEAHSLPLIVLR
jgi:hypothetical protein